MTKIPTAPVELTPRQMELLRSAMQDSLRHRPMTAPSLRDEYTVIDRDLAFTKTGLLANLQAGRVDPELRTLLERQAAERAELIRRQERDVQEFIAVGAN